MARVDHSHVPKGRHNGPWRRDDRIADMRPPWKTRKSGEGGRNRRKNISHEGESATDALEQSERKKKLTGKD
jgi:hypothetical protein